jgi:hypothetical protein
MRVDNELADDQAEDDARSVTFDGAPLEADLTVVGRPAVEIAFRVDRPVGQLCLRLCDVAPDGVSERVSYRPFNLCAWDGFEEPQALEPGRLYRARVALNACGHRFRAGHRIRLAVSTSYWPVVWPSPEAATVTLALEGCRLVLPEWRDELAVAPDPPGPPREFPTLDADTLRGTQSMTRRFTDDRESVLETSDDFGMARNRADGLAIGNLVRQRFAIAEGDPLSTSHEAWWRYELDRDGWAVSIDSHARMTCDEVTFRLERAVTAREGNCVVFDRHWTRSVPRRLL